MTFSCPREGQELFPDLRDKKFKYWFV